MVRNLGINAVSCVVMFGVGLLMVPLLVGAYGLVEYGLIMAARLFLLEGLMRVFDFGLPEVAARAVARRRGGDAGTAGGQVPASLLLGTGLGLLTAGGLALATPALTGMLVDDAIQYRDDMAMVLLWTAAALVLQYPGQVCEGILRGRERFDWVRGAEVAYIALAGLASLLLVWQGRGFAAVALAWVALSTLKFAVLMLVAWTTRDRSVPRGVPAGGALGQTVRLGWGLWLNRVYLTAVAFLPQLLIARFLGPAALGLYDILNRPVRYLRMALNLVSSAVYPAAARLDGAGADGDLRRMVTLSGALTCALFLPALTAVLVFADRVLAVWVGADYAVYGPWLAALMGWMLLMVASQPGIMALTSRPAALHRLNRLGFLQLGLLVAIGLLLVERLEALAFIAGSMAAALLVIPWQMGLIRREVGLGWGGLLRHPVRFLAGGLLPLALLPWLPATPVDSTPALLGLGTGWVALHYLGILLIGLTGQERRTLWHLTTLRLRPHRA